MFTKEDYEKYFDQIARVERKMIYGVYDLGREIEDPSLRRVLEKIGEDEVRHYGSVLKMLKCTAEPESSEKRREAREHDLGPILLRSPQGVPSAEIRARCVNLSKKGICLECAEALLPLGVWDLEIRLFDRGEEISRRGKVVWSKKVEENLFISGLEFEL